MSVFNTLLSHGLVADLAASTVLDGTEFYVYTGTYPTTETSKAVQLADDVAAVEAKKAYLDSTQTILGVAGTLVMSLYTLISGVVAAINVRFGTARYSGGSTGTCVVPVKTNVVSGVAVDVSDTGTYPTTAVSKAAQLATDIAAVEAEAEHIELGTTILTVPGELDIIDLTPKAGVVGPDYVLMGHENYTDGEDGTYVPTTPETTKKGTEFGANGVEVGTFDGSTSVEMTANGWFNVVETARSDEWRLKIEADSWDHLDLFPEVRVEIGASGFSLKGNNILTSLKNILLAFKESGRFMVARVWADQYPISLILGGVSYPIASSADTLLTSGSPAAFAVAAREWPLDITGANEIHGIDLVGDVSAVLENGLVTIGRGEGPVTWLARQVCCSRPVFFSVARVVGGAATGLTFKLYREGSMTVGAEIAITGGDCFRLPRLAPGRRWRVDLEGAGANEIVERVELGTSMAALG